MENELIEFKKHLARLFEKHGIAALNANDKRAYIGFSKEEDNPNNIRDHFTFNYNNMSDANSIPFAYNDDELDKIIGKSAYRGAFVSEFIEDVKPLLNYYGVKAIKCSDGGTYSLRWDDGNKFIMENVDLELQGQLA